MPVLDGGLSVRPSCASGVVDHAVCAAGRNGRVVAVHIAAPDFALAVPVRELHQIEQPNGAPGREVILAPLTTLSSGTRTSRCAGQVDQRRSAGLGIMAGDRVVAADILAGAGVLGEAALGLIRDVEVPFLVGGIVDNTEVILGDEDNGIVAASREAALPLLVAYGIVDDVVLVHAAPREIVVEGRAAGAGTDRRRGIRGDVDIDQSVRIGGLLQPRQRRRLRIVIPANAEDLDIGQLQRIAGVGAASYAAGGRLAVLGGGDAPRAGVRQVELCRSVAGGRERGGTVDRLDRRAAVDGDGEGAELHRCGVTAAGGRHRRRRRGRGYPALGGRHGIGAGIVDGQRTLAVAAAGAGILLRAKRGGHDCAGFRRYGQRSREVTQRHRVLLDLIHDHSLGGGGLPVQRGIQRPCTVAREIKNAFTADAGASQRSLAVRTGDSRSGGNRDLQLWSHAAALGLFPCVYAGLIVGCRAVEGLHGVCVQIRLADRALRAGGRIGLAGEWLTSVQPLGERVEVAGNAIKEGVERFTVIGQIGRVAGAGQLPLILAAAVLAAADVFLARSAVIVVLPCGTLGRGCRRS